MNYTHLLLREGELFLKGKNRSRFEQKLVDTIQRMLGVKVSSTLQGRIILPYFSEHLSLQRIFGIVSYSPVIRVEKGMEQIQSVAVSLLQGKQGTFKVETRRSDKRFPLTSLVVNKLVGEAIEQRTPLQFSFHSPQQVLSIEINADAAYVFLETIPCFGGLPLGIEGNVLLLVEDEASILAGLLTMRRGCDIIPVSLAGEKDISLLQKFSPNPLKLGQVRTLAQVEEIANLEKISAMVVGDQFDTRRRYEVSLMVLRPLLAHRKEQIQEELQKFKGVKENN